MEDRLKVASEERDAMLRLKAQAGWIILTEAIEERREALLDEAIRTPCGSVDGAFAQEFQKGKLAGYLDFTRLPDHIIDQANAVIESLRAPEEDMSDAA